MLDSRVHPLPSLYESIKSALFFYISTGNKFSFFSLDEFLDPVNSSQHQKNKAVSTNFSY